MSKKCATRAVGLRQNTVCTSLSPMPLAHLLRSVVPTALGTARQGQVPWTPAPSTRSRSAQIEYFWAPLALT